MKNKQRQKEMEGEIKRRKKCRINVEKKKMKIGASVYSERWALNLFLNALDTWRSRDLRSAECASLTTRILHNSPLQSVTGVWTWVKKKKKKMLTCLMTAPLLGGRSMKRLHGAKSCLTLQIFCKGDRVGFFSKRRVAWFGWREGWN